MAERVQYGLNFVRVPQEVRERLKAGEAVSGVLRPKKPREAGASSDSVFEAKGQVSR